MTCVDQNVTNKEKRKAQRLEDEKRRKENYEEKWALQVIIYFCALNFMYRLDYGTC